MRWLMVITLVTSVACSTQAQQLIERTTVTEKFSAPIPQAPPTIRKTVTTTYSVPVIVDRPVYLMPMYSAPGYAVPVYGKSVAEYRTGLFGLRRNVVHANGSVSQYGPMGRKR